MYMYVLIITGAPPPENTVLGTLSVLVCEAGALVNPDQYGNYTIYWIIIYYYLIYC
jgi:hypothetical protein